MAGKKDKNVVCVTTNLTDTQAAQLVSEFAKAKNRIAPNARSTAAITNKEGIGGLLQKGLKQITGK